MRYLEDTLAEECLSKTLYPKTRILVSRRKVDGSIFEYTNDIDVKIDFSKVDPYLLESKTKDPEKIDKDYDTNFQKEKKQKDKDLRKHEDDTLGDEIKEKIRFENVEEETVEKSKKEGTEKNVRGLFSLFRKSKIKDDENED